MSSFGAVLIACGVVAFLMIWLLAITDEIDALRARVRALESKVK